jgi:beta-ureidopropionase / N-carbamoyl-L-amino-acid hydrolase
LNVDDASAIARRALDLLPDAAALFDALRNAGCDGPGVTREAFGPRETAAQELVAAVAEREALAVERDGAGNLVVTLPGRDPTLPFVAVGSHLDSVPRGGNYDGAAGVLAGLVAFATLRRQHVVPPRTLRLFALRGEESAWFGKSWIGSHALLGLLTAADLAQPRVDSGRTLAEHLRDLGADLDAIVAGAPLVPRERIAAFLEVHIEQGPVLEERGMPLGVVTAIYGNLRHRRVVCRGEAAHAGATPRALRHDAVVALADLVVRLDARCAEWLAAGRSLVVTHGIIGTDPREHAISRVAGEAMMSLEIRADDDATLEAFHRLARDEAAAVALERGVSFDFDAAIVNRPAPMSAAWIEHLDALCAEEGHAHMRLPSGAGHDAAVFAAAGVPTGMLFIRNRHGSHNPREHMELADFGAAVQVLVRALLAPVE